MPQMAPYNWLHLNILFFLSMISFSSIIHYKKLYPIINIYIKQLSLVKKFKILW